MKWKCFECDSVPCVLKVKERCMIEPDTCPFVADKEPKWMLTD